MRLLAKSMLLLALCGFSRAALAQVVDPEIFGDGKPPAFRQEDIDRRFLKSGINAALENPPKNPECRKVLATLLVAYSEALTYVHRKDQNFIVDPVLLNTVKRTVVTNDFDGMAFLQAMVRRTMIEKKVPPGWIATAEKLRDELTAPIEVARMKLYETQVAPVDSFLFTMPALLDRYQREVKLAPSVSVDTAEDKFRDKYMDRDIAWGGLILHDIAQQAPEPPPKKAKKRKKSDPPPEPPPELPYWAVVGFPVGRPQAQIFGGPAQIPQVEIRARLKPDQLVELNKLVRGSRVLIKGHLWDITSNMGYVEVRDAYIFPDPDWNTWQGIASPNDVYNCSIAVNDLSAYGYQKRPGQNTAPDPFKHTKE